MIYWNWPKFCLIFLWFTWIFLLNPGYTYGHRNFINETWENWEDCTYVRETDPSLAGTSIEVSIKYIIREYLTSIIAKKKNVYFQRVRKRNRLPTIGHPTKTFILDLLWMQSSEYEQRHLSLSRLPQRSSVLDWVLCHLWQLHPHHFQHSHMRQHLVGHWRPKLVTLFTDQGQVHGTNHSHFLVSWCVYYWHYLIIFMEFTMYHPCFVYMHCYHSFEFTHYGFVNFDTQSLYHFNLCC